MTQTNTDRDSGQVTSDPSVAAEARAALSTFREIVGNVLQGLPGGWGSATQIANELGIERTLAWKISRIGSSPDPFAAAQHLPGDRALGQLWNAFKRHGVDKDTIELARSAVAKYRSLEAHTDDRTSLQLMVASQATRGREEVELTQRKAAFRANNFFVGVSAQVAYSAMFFVPNEADREYLDMVLIRGYQGLMCLRSGVNWPVARPTVSVHTDGPVEHMGVALLPEFVEQGVPVLRPFCSPNLPPLEKSVGLDGRALFSVPHPPIGKAGSMDVFIGERISRSTRATATEREPNFVIAVRFRTPARLAVIDCFVHRSVGPLRMTLSAASLLFGDPSLEELQGDLRLHVPLFERVEHVGRADRAVVVREIRGCTKLIEFGANAAGTPLQDLDLYRVTIEYPPEPTLVVLRAPIPVQSQNSSS